jgi:hypothetical protein
MPLTTIAQKTPNAIILHLLSTGNPASTCWENDIVGSLMD